MAVENKVTGKSELREALAVSLGEKAPSESEVNEACGEFLKRTAASSVYGYTDAGAGYVVALAEAVGEESILGGATGFSTMSEGIVRLAEVNVARAAVDEAVSRRKTIKEAKRNIWMAGLSAVPSTFAIVAGFAVNPISGVLTAGIEALRFLPRLLSAFSTKNQLEVVLSEDKNAALEVSNRFLSSKAARLAPSIYRKTRRYLDYGMAAIYGVTAISAVLAGGSVILPIAAGLTSLYFLGRGWVGDGPLIAFYDGVYRTGASMFDEEEWRKRKAKEESAVPQEVTVGGNDGTDETESLLGQDDSPNPVDAESEVTTESVTGEGETIEGTE